MSNAPNQRILLVDDMPSIHEDFRKILAPAERDAPELDAALAGLLGGSTDGAPPAEAAPSADFELECASQGREALERVRAAVRSGRPYAVAFVDVRMPPGWDGVKTIQELWRADPALQTVLCTAYSDYSWDQIIAQLGSTDRLLILKKPFDPIEISQLSIALTEKWNAARRERELRERLGAAEEEARAYASSLETVNRALVTAKASADAVAAFKTNLLYHLGEEVQSSVQRILAGLPARTAGAPAGDASGEPIVIASQRLLAVFDAAIEMASLDSGRDASEREACDLSQLVREVCKDLRPLADAKGISLALRCPADLPESIELDRNRVRRCLGRLVENAVARTEKGTVRISLGMQWGGDWHSGVLRVEVADAGEAVPEECHGTIFDAYLEPGSRRGGSLGLVVAKKLAEAIGGEIEFENASEGGAVFTLVLPIGSSLPAQVMRR